jgi:hypothetical protein
MKGTLLVLALAGLFLQAFQEVVLPLYGRLCGSDPEGDRRVRRQAETVKAIYERRYQGVPYPEWPLWVRRTYENALRELEGSEVPAWLGEL